MDNMVKQYILFIFILGGLFTFIAVPSMGFGSAPAQGGYFVNTNQLNGQIKNGTQFVQFTTVNQGITSAQEQPGNSPYATTSTITGTSIVGNTTITTTTTTVLSKGPTNSRSACVVNGGIFTQFDLAMCDINTAIANGLRGLVCYIAPNSTGPTGCLGTQPIPPVSAQNPPVLLNANNTIGTYNQDVSIGSNNNSVLSILDSPLTQAVSIALLFIGLGWLAGTFGAGILANYMGRVGIAVSLFYYFNATMLSFGSVPAIIMIFINAIIAVPTVILFYESLGGGSH